jgi:hypothetical protein
MPAPGSPPRSPGGSGLGRPCWSGRSPGSRCRKEEERCRKEAWSRVSGHDRIGHRHGGLGCGPSERTDRSPCLVACRGRAWFVDRPSRWTGARSRRRGRWTGARGGRGNRRERGVGVLRVHGHAEDPQRRGGSVAVQLPSEARRWRHRPAGARPTRAGASTFPCSAARRRTEPHRGRPCSPTPMMGRTW